MALTGYGGIDELGGHTFKTDDPSNPTIYVPDIPEARQLAQALQMSQPETQPTAGGTTLRLSSYGQDPSQQRPQVAPSVIDVPTPQPGGPAAPFLEQPAQGPAAPLFEGTPPAAKSTPSQAYIAQGGKAVARPTNVGMQRGAIAPAAQTVADYNAIPMLPGAGQASEGEGVGLSPEEEAWVNGHQAYSPGTTQQQLQARVPTGVAMPTSQAFEVTGAIPENPEVKAAWVGAKKAEAEAQQRIAGTEAARADAAQMEALNQRIHAENEAVFAKAHQQAIESEARNKMLRIHEFDQEAQQRYADFGPDRFFKQRGNWAVIGAAIAQGLGAYAATIRGGPNFAQQIIQGAIDRDVESQRQEYLRDRDTRNNLVGELTQATGDVDAATEAAKAIQLNIAQAHANELAALSKRTDISNNWDLWRAQFQAGIADHMQKAYERGLGNTVIKTQATIKYPQAGGGGGPLTPEQRLHRETVATNLVEQRAKRKGFQGENLTPEQEKSVEKLSERMGPIVDLDAANKQIRRVGIPNDLVTHLPGATTVAGAASLLGHPKTAEQISAKDQWIAAYSKMMTGVGGSPEEFARRRKDVAGRMESQAVLDAAVKASEQKVKEEKRNVLAAYPPAVRRAWAKRQGIVLQEEKASGQPEEAK